MSLPSTGSSGITVGWNRRLTSAAGGSGARRDLQDEFEAEAGPGELVIDLSDESGGLLDDASEGGDQGDGEVTERSSSIVFIV